jgi:hypothetical protein
MNNVIVFDLDETLGFFQEINYLWHLLKNLIPNNLYFFKLLDLYPEFLRPNILIILNYIKYAKNKNLCSNVIIFTNNQTSSEWVSLIKNYFNNKINFELFDKIVGAFKINDKQFEIDRTSHKKKYIDFINCTKLPKYTKICYIDDKYYETMENKNLIYIKIKPYIYELSKEVLLNRLYNNINLFNINYEDKFINLLKNNFNYIFLNKNEDINIHKILSKKIIEYIENFLNNKLYNY